MNFKNFLAMTPRQHSELEVIDLCYDDLVQLDVVQLQALGAALAQCPKLQQLNLDVIRANCTPLGAIGATEWQAFCTALARCSAKLEVIDLSFNELTYLDVVGWQALGAALAQFPKLRHLDLRGNTIPVLGTTEWQAFCSALARCSELQHIGLNSCSLNRLGAARWQELVTALAQCPKLQHIDLSHNNLLELDAAVWQALGAPLAQCPALQHINLGGNDLRQLDAAVWQALGAAFAQCPKLQHIDLSSNFLGKLDVARWQTLGKALAQCRVLQSINLAENEIGGLDNAQFAGLLNTLSQWPIPLQVIADSLPEERRHCIRTICATNNHGYLIKRVMRATAVLQSNDPNNIWDVDAGKAQSLPKEIREEILLYAFPEAPKKLIQGIGETLQKMRNQHTQGQG